MLSTAKRDVLRLAKEREVADVRLAFVDIFGVEKSVVIPVARLERALAGAVTFDGGSIDGFVRGEEIDMVLRPDPATWTVLPWTRDGRIEARLLCEVETPDGEPFEGDSRGTLRRVLDDARDVLATVTCGLEVEFYLFEPVLAAPGIATRDSGSYFDFSPSDRGEDARAAIVAALEAMGIGIESAHHELGAGQHEIDVQIAPALAAADALVALRGTAKHVAARFGLEATFMPKPLETSAGNGLHVEFALPDLDEDARLHAIGGLLAHAPACTAIGNPTVNSFKRLVAAWDAPIYTVWSERSANALVRVPAGPAGISIEHRSPDPSCNPYLTLAVLVESIADGLRRRLLPGDPFTGSTYDLTERYRAEHGIRLLPKSLRQAITELDADGVVRGALGDHIYHAFRDAKLAEYERYRRAVHPWEREEYLRRF